MIGGGTSDVRVDPAPPARYGAKNRSSSNSRSTAASSAGMPRHASGRIDSYKLA
jgi:hypothetical protein